MTTEKSPLKSKKFLAYMEYDLSMKVLFALVLFWGWETHQMGYQPFFILLAIVVVTGFVAVGYILGVAQLDKYVRLAKIAADSVGGTTNGSAARVIAKGTKGLIELHPETPPPDDEEDPEEDPEEGPEEDPDDPDEEEPV